VRNSRIRFLRQSGGCPRAVPWRAVVRVGELDVSPLSPASGCSARRRLPSRGSLGPHFPTFTGTMLSYDCPVSLSGRFAARSLPNTLSAPSVCVPHSGSLVVGSCLPAPGLLFSRYPCSSGTSDKETRGSPKFPSSPSEDMPRSQTPVVSSTLALTRPGLLPSGACKPSAFPSIPPEGYPTVHNYTHFGAQSRGLPPRYPRLRTAPYGEARGFATDRLARR
jgi:hypothetical protein